MSQAIVQAVPANTDFSNSQQCLELVQALPLTRFAVAQEMLGVIINGMLDTPPAPVAAYFAVLEAARAPLALVQDEMASRYAAKPQPPDAEEETDFSRVLALWRAMESSYARIAEIAANEPTTHNLRPLFLQRCIHYSGKIIAEHFRARREPGRNRWLNLHRHYAAAEKYVVAATLVPEPLNGKDQQQSCIDAYIAVLLLEIANPYSRNPRELAWIFRWAQRFAALATLAPVAADAAPQSYVVDLEQDSGLRPLATHASSANLPANLRRLCNENMGQELARLIEQLQQKVDPVTLGLGEDCGDPACNRLLLQLYRPWGHAAIARRHRRLPASGAASVCIGFEQIHFYLSGEKFTQPENIGNRFSRSDTDVIGTFGQKIDPARALHIAAEQVSFNKEKWEIIDQSVGGFRLRREPAGARIAYGALLGIWPPAAEHSLLCRVNWLMRENTGGLLIGAYVMSRELLPIAARRVALTAQAEKYSRAFMLPAMPDLKEQASLIIPRGWFQAQRIIEIYTDQPIRVQMLTLLTQGHDFDRVSYQISQK